MGARRGIAAEMGETWGDDTIYSESFCHQEDVFYEGSENEDYKNSATRRQRYEQAGQLFLSGTVPHLISAALRGPFDESSGWANPWTSNRHRESSANRPQISAEAEKMHISQSKTSTRKPIRGPKLQARTTESYLPSPESLKQAPYTQTHPYLEADEVDKVNRWRERVDPAERTKDDFWVADKADCAASTRKRRASGPEWLKKMSVKKQRSAATQRSLHNRVDDDEIDELMADMPSSSFEDFAPLNSSPSKRNSPRIGFQKASGKNLAESDDELSPNKGAAATLSSPVSLRNRQHVSSSMIKSEPSNYITLSAGTQTTPSHLRQMNLLDVVPTTDEIVLLQDPDEMGCDVAISDADAEDNEGSVETMSEAPSVSLSVQENALDQDANNAETPVSKGNSGAAITATDDASMSEPHDQHLARNVEEVMTKSDLQLDTAKDEMDTELQDVSTVKSESESQSPKGGDVHELTPCLNTSLARENNGAESEDQSMNERSLSLPHTHSGQALNMHLVEEKVGCETEHETDRKDELGSQADEMPDDSCKSSAQASSVSQDDISLDYNESSGSQDTNNRSASADVTTAGGDIIYEDSLEKENSAPDNISTPKTPTQVDTIKGTSEFSFRSIFNRFTPTSPWIGLSKLTSSSSQPTTENSGAKDTTMSDDPDHNAEPDTKSGGADVASANVIVQECAEQASALQDHKSDNALPNQHDAAPTIDLAPSQELTQLQPSGLSGKTESPAKSPTEEGDSVSISQQSPWTKTEHAVLFRAPLEMLSPNLSGVTSGRRHNETNPILETQTPWAKNTFPNVDASEPSASVPNNENFEPADSTKLSLPRPSTPEPQFCVKSFSSFLSPSPDRRQKGHLSLPHSKSSSRHSHGSPLSVLKTRWSHHRPGLRVSWASSLVEVEGTSPDHEPSPCTHLPKRQGSPPPDTSISALPVTENIKFAKHFEAVANRTDETRQTLIPTESQQKLSPGPLAMAETFMAADTEEKAQELSAKTTERVACSRASEEPMDVLEDIVREMGEDWDAWNIDAELEQARKEPQTGSRPSMEW